MRVTVVLGAGLLLALAAGCGSRRAVGPPPTTTSRAPVTTPHPAASQVLAAPTSRCAPGSLRPLGSRRVAYAGVAPGGTVARARPGGPVVARFGPRNVNHYPTVLGILGKVVRSDCSADWYRVELPVKPNGSSGYVRASTLSLARVSTRIVVSVSQRRLTLYRDGRPVLRAPVAVGAPGTPTPTGRYYVDQRLVPDDPAGPYGPAAIGISAHSDVLTGWAQGGPVAIHGTDEPWSIGHAVSNGCIRLHNPTLEKVFPLAVAGTPVVIRP